MKLILCVTDDEYELPIAVAKTQSELSRALDVPTSTIQSALQKGTKSALGRYIQIEIGDTDVE